MKSLLSVIKFTAYDLLHKKAFIISNIFMLLVLIIGLNYSNIMSYFDKEENSLILIVDTENIYMNSLNTLSNYVISNDYYNEEELEYFLDENIYEYIIEVYLEDEDLRYTVLTYAEEYTTIEDELIELESIYLELKENNFVVDDEIYKFSETDVLTDEEISTYANYLVATITSIMLFYAIYFYAIQVSSSVTTEKTSKIIELLLTSTSPKIIIVGKTLGIGLVGFMQIVLFSLIGVISTNLFIDKEIIDIVLNIINLSYSTFIIIVIYFILGYLLYSFLFALTGATVNRIEDIQSANSPVTIIVVLSFYLAFFSMADANSITYSIATFLPFSSPFLMPISYINGTSTIIEVIISILILMITVFIISLISIKIYKSAILNYGSKLRIKALVKMYKEKN